MNDAINLESAPVIFRPWVPSRGLLEAAASDQHLRNYLMNLEADLTRPVIVCPAGEAWRFSA